jgi:hypothetical protein
MNYKKFLPELNTDQNTVMEFFVVFSRFEFALKKAGYLNNGKDDRRAEPNWLEFETKYRVLGTDPIKYFSVLPCWHGSF